MEGKWEFCSSEGRGCGFCLVFTFLSMLHVCVSASALLSPSPAHLCLPPSLWGSRGQDEAKTVGRSDIGSKDAV